MRGEPRETVVNSAMGFQWAGRGVKPIVRRRPDWALDTAIGILAACALSAACWLVVFRLIFR